MNTWLSFTVMLRSVEDSSLPAEQNLLCELKLTGGAWLKASELVMFPSFILSCLNLSSESEHGIAYPLLRFTNEKKICITPTLKLQQL